MIKNIIKIIWGLILVTAFCLIFTASYDSVEYYFDAVYAKESCFELNGCKEHQCFIDNRAYFTNEFMADVFTLYEADGCAEK